ncbi:hypothetical protein FRC10_007249, partial [Ceratobasidium sp. 414]
PVLQRVKRAWTVTKTAAEATNAAQLTVPRSMPRDLACLHVEGTGAWNSLGRRKRRCRAFHAIGHTFAAQRHLVPATTSSLMSLDTELVPTRPSTPEGLRMSILNNFLLLSGAARHGAQAAYGCPTQALPTPPVPALPPPPTLPVCAFQTFPRTQSLSLTGPYEVVNSVGVVDMVVDGDVMTAVSMGRHSAAPWLPNDFPAVVQSIRESELEVPGGLAYLYQVLFPGGVRDPATALTPTVAMMQLVHGWWYAMDEHIYQFTPRPKR